MNIKKFIYLITIFLCLIVFNNTVYSANVKNSAVIFMYHKFNVPQYPSTNITVKQFESHLNEFSKKLAKPSFNENWLVVSSASHLRRVMNVSSKAKWNLIPYATDFNHPKKYKFKLSFNFLSNIYQFEKASHEWIGLFYYLLSGKADKI